MKTPTEKQLKEAARIFALKGASIGGRKRWEGKTAQQKRNHALMMVKARGKNSSKKVVDN